MNIHALLVLSLALITICNGYTSPPPEGLYFMLRSKKYSDFCLYSDQTGNFPQLALCELGVTQMFWTIYGLDTAAGTFWLKNKRDNKCIKDTGSDIDVDNSCAAKQKFKWGMDGATSDSNYFRLKGARYSKCMCSQSLLPLLTRGGCATDDRFYWTFDYEDYSLTDVSYTDVSATSVTDAPDFMASKYCDNTGGGSGDITITITYSEEETWEESYEYSEGFEMAIGTEFEAELPIGLSTTVSVTSTFSSTQTWGQTQSETKTMEGSVSTTCVAGEYTSTTVYITSTTYEVPYTMTFAADSDPTMVFYTYGTCSVKYWLLSVSTSLVNTSAVIPNIDYHPETELGIGILYWIMGLLVVSLSINIGCLFKCIVVNTPRHKYEVVSESV